jgi:hypothetical protein
LAIIYNQKKKQVNVYKIAITKFHSAPPWGWWNNERKQEFVSFYMVVLYWRPINAIKTCCFVHLFLALTAICSTVMPTCNCECQVIIVRV